MPDRRQHIQDQLDKYGIKPFWVDCEDCENIHGYPTDYSPAMAFRYIKRHMGKGELAGLMSHLRAYQCLIQSDQEWGLIVEDDVELFRNPMEELSGFEGRLVLGVETKDQNLKRRKVKKREGRVIELAEAPYGAYCYAIHRVFAGEAIATLRQGLGMPIDVFFRYASRQRSGFWQVEGVSREHQIGMVSAIGDEARMADYNPECWRPKANHNECPKLIHQIWVGDKPVPEGVESWKRQNPGRIHVLWDEAKIEPIVGDYGLLQIFRKYLTDGGYPGAADIARYCILHRFGGMYADADSVALRPIDIGTPFASWESEYHRPGLVSNSFIQVKPGCPIMRECIHRIKETDHPVPGWQLWKVLGPQLLTDVAHNHEIEKLPSGLFAPNHFVGPNPPIESPPYSTHEWGSTNK